ncbi:hypothetical protein C8Q74DRAFT_795597 [Fomes fomentarius]|nr:hypothetical protein C8Q74DRAFT_795597 [Fomes fomentarius]
MLNGEVVVGACLLSPATITAVVSLRLRVETPGEGFGPRSMQTLPIAVSALSAAERYHCSDPDHCTPPACSVGSAHIGHIHHLASVTIPPIPHGSGSNPANTPPRLYLARIPTSRLLLGSSVLPGTSSIMVYEVLCSCFVLSISRDIAYCVCLRCTVRSLTQPFFSLIISCRWRRLSAMLGYPARSRPDIGVGR